MLKLVLVCGVALGCFLIVVSDSEFGDIPDPSVDSESIGEDDTTEQNQEETTVNSADDDEEENGDEILPDTDDAETETAAPTTKRPKTRQRGQKPSNRHNRRKNKKRKNNPTEPARNDSENEEFSTVPSEVESTDSNEAEVVKDENSVCPTPPDIDGLVSPIQLGTEHPLDTVISYQCQFGYVSRSSGSLLSTCKIDESTGKPEWTRPNTACIPRSCGDPGYLPNGRRIGNLFTFPNKVEFECHEGYRLQGLRDRYCQAGGDWSGRLPICVSIYCPAPSNPPNGRVHFDSLDYGSELQYECNKGFMLRNNTPRICTKDGTWSNDEPECIETRCKIPEAPYRGSVHLSDEAKVDSLAVYSCSEDTSLIGHATSKCLSTGDWLFDQPKCLRYCTVPFVQNGALGRLQTKPINRYRSQTVFVPIKVNEHVKHDEIVILGCEEGFYPGDLTTDNAVEVSCNDGIWSRPFLCQASQKRPCTSDPPPIENGYPAIKTASHGKSTWYKCNPGYTRVKDGKVECKNGEWIGPTPVCGDSRCYLNHLNYPGLLLKTGKLFANDREEIDIQCDRDYVKSTVHKVISCDKGKWVVKDKPCTLKTCDQDPPLVKNGRWRYFSRENGSIINYECHENYILVGRSSVQCLFGDWTGELPVCTPSSSNSELLSITVTEDTNKSSEPWNPTEYLPNKLHFENCFCTFDYRIDLIYLRLGNEVLNAEDRVKKGEVVTFACKYPQTDLVWPNGLRFYEKMDLTCNRCHQWKMDELPICEIRQPGDSLIFYESPLNILPGGQIEVSHYSKVTLHCINAWLQPKWSIPVLEGVSSYESSAQTKQQNGYFSNHIFINSVQLNNAGRYECFGEDNGNRYRSTVVDLKIEDSDDLCPELATDTNRGSFNIIYLNGRKLNSKAYYACKDRFKMVVGSNERRCQENGKWSSSYPACEDILCPVLSEANTFSINYSNGRKLHSIARYQCKSSTQNLLGSSTRTCLHSGQWSGDIPVCDEVTCPEFRTYNGLLVSYSKGTKVGSIATFRCSNQATLVGSEISKCLVNGTWSHSKPSCEMMEIRCPLIDGKGIFNISYDNYRRINSTAQFFCKAKDKKVEGCNILKCQQSGEWSAEWSGEYPICVEYSVCKKFDDTPGLEISYSDKGHVGSQASFRCLPPATLLGNSVSVCKPDGTWSLPLSVCLAPKNCEDFAMSPGLVISYSDEVRVGSVASFECSAPAKLVGSTWAKCRADGTWNQRAPYCQGYITCEEFVRSPGLEILYSDSTNVGSIASFKCEASLFMVGSSWAECKSSGTWSHMSPFCQAPGCYIDSLMKTLSVGVIPDMTNVTSELVSSGTELDLKCEDDLFPSGNNFEVKAICTTSGEWKYGSIQCVLGCRLSDDVSTLLKIEPVKSHYRFGEFIILSCPSGYKLNSNVEKMMCLGKTWSDVLPQCVKREESSTSGA